MTDTSNHYEELEPSALRERIVELDNSGDALIPFSAASLELVSREVQLDHLVRHGDVHSAMFRGGRLVRQLLRLADATASTTQLLIAGAAKDAKRDLLIASAHGYGEASWNLGLMQEHGLGSEASSVRAAEWFGLAAYQFHAKGAVKQVGEALEQLARLYPSHPFLSLFSGH